MKAIFLLIKATAEDVEVKMNRTLIVTLFVLIGLLCLYAICTFAYRLNLLPPDTGSSEQIAQRRIYHY